jgi:hypothetical protein
MRGIFVAVGIIIVQAGAALAAPQIKQPACAALEAWGAHVNAETYNVAPRLALPKALEDAQVVPLFGVGVLAWTPEDLQAANRLLTQCYGEAGKRRDAAAAGALVNANRALQGLVPRTNAVLQKAKADAEPLVKQIAGLPDSPELDRGLAAVLKINPAQPDITPFRTLPHEVADPLWRLASQVLPVLANTERETLFKMLSERHVAIQSNMASAAEKTIAAAPADADGMIQLIAVTQRVAALDDAAARTRLVQSAGDRLKQIGDTLRQAKPPAWVPPSCVELYRWSSGTNATAGVAMGGRSVMNAFLDERVVALFGVSLADWSDQDLARFKALRGLCQSAWQAQAALPGNTGPNAPELVQLASRGRWIDGADQQIADAKTTIGGSQRAHQALAADIEKARTLPDTTASLLPLAQLSVDPAQTLAPPDERMRFINAINEKRAAIGAHAADAAIKGLADVKLASLDDLKNLFAYAAQTLPTIPDPRGQQTFRDAFNRTMQEATARLLPEFKAKLDAAPASLASVAEVNTTLLQLNQVTNQVAATPAFQIYYKAMQESRDAMAKSARSQACAEFLPSVGAGSDAKEPLFWGGFGPGASTLGDFLCAIAEHATTVSYAGPGMFSSTSTLKVTKLKEAMLTISMHKAEVQAGKQMLVGYEVADANGSATTPSPTPTGKISIEEWSLIANDLTGLGGETDECITTIDGPAPDKLEPTTKLLWLHCWTLDLVRSHISKRLQGQR